MKTYLFLCAFIFSIININAQKSTITFNQYKDLDSDKKEALSDVYHNMKSLNYHYFDLVSKDEREKHNTLQLLQKAKARATIITEYYKTVQHVSPENLVVVYGGQTPILSLYKEKSVLTPSGEVLLGEEEQQCYSFNTSSQYPIVSNNGNTFYFPPNAFETLTGQQLLNKDISICLWEFTDKKSLVYSGLTTSSNDKMIETAGSFYIEASYNGEKLQLRNGHTYSVRMVSEKKFDDMFTYYGGKAAGVVNWEVDKNEPAIYNTPNYELDENVNIAIEDQNYDEYREALDEEYYEEETVNFYELSAGKLGWINCDRFYDIKNPATLAIKVNSEKPLVVRLVFRDINSVLPAYNDSNHKDQYQTKGIPKGEKVLLMAYSVKDDGAIFGYKEIVVGENKTEEITLTNLSKNRFKGAVSELLSF